MTATLAPPWRFDEFTHRGTDYANTDHAAAYERNRPTADETALCAQLGVGPGKVVVDLGCGHGSFAIEAARAGATVHAVDVSTAMLDLVRRSAEEAGLNSIELHHAGFLSFALVPSTVDVVVARFSLHHLPDFWKAVALSAIAHMLRPSGLFYLHDIVFSFNPADHERAISTWADEITRTTSFSRTEVDAHVRDEYSTFVWIFEGLCERAGLSLKSRTLSRDVFAEYVWARV